MHLPYFRGKKVVIVVVILLFAAVGTALAGGQQEDPIATARDLIIRNRLNDAIILLTEAVRKKPELIDRAEGLMQKIRSIRGEYYTLWEQLIKTIKNEPNRPEKAIALINRMKALDAAPNERTRQNLNEWESIVQFRYNLDRFDKVMVAGDQQLKDGKYLDAVRTYVSGFDIFRPEFESAGYSQQLIVDRANSAVRQLNNTVNQFEGLTGRVSTAGRSLAASFSAGKQADIEAQLADYSTQFSTVLTLRDGLNSIAETLAQLNGAVHLERPSVQQDWYLTFLTWYIRGRPEATGGEGIIAAMAGFLDSAHSAPEDAARTLASDQYQKALSAYQNDATAAARTAFQTVRATSELGLRLEQLWERRIDPGPGLVLTADARAAVNSRLPAYLLFQYQAHAAESYIEVSNLKEQTTPIDIVPTDTAATLSPKQATVKNAVNRVVNTLSYWQSAQAALKGAESPYAGKEAAAVVDAAVGDFNLALDGLRAKNAQLVTRMANLRLTGESERYALAAKQVDEGTRFLEGVQESTTVQGASATVTYHYPDRALALFQEANNTLESMTKTLNGYVSDIEAASTGSNSSSNVDATVADMKKLSASAQQVLGTLGDKLSAARNNTQLATSLRNRADRSVQEATAALQRNDVQTAINKIQEARDLSLQSLQLQQDAAYSQSIDNRLAALGDQIKRVNYVRVVNLVRDLINKGRSEYQQDQFAQAERDLLQARTLWSQVSPNEPQLEVENWLRLVQSALNLQNTRELTEVDPLFFTLGNYLNRAKENFAEGKQLWTSGNTQEGQKYLTKAEDNIQSVVVARPFNQEARVLSLRILQLTNPRQFPQIFKQRFDEAVNRSKTEPQAALVDLYDLRAIDSTFPGLAAAINSLEIQLGIRPNPVTVAKKQQADALVAEAQRLAATGTRAQTEVAVARLETALQLNPDNTNAQVLLDRYRIALGSPATYTLPSATMQEFAQAQNLFIAGRLADALAIVDRIWQNPSNRGYAPLVDLRKNILSRLGQ